MSESVTHWSKRENFPTPYTPPEVFFDGRKISEFWGRFPQTEKKRKISFFKKVSTKNLRTPEIFRGAIANLQTRLATIIEKQLGITADNPFVSEPVKEE